MFKYTPFFKVLEHIMDLDFETDEDVLELDDRFSLNMDFEGMRGMRLTYHRIYKGKDSGEIFAFNLAHFDDPEIVRRASEGKSSIYNEMMDKLDSAESCEKYILFSIFKEKMNFAYSKIKSELRGKKKEKEEELNFIKVDINEKSEKFLEVINSTYPGHFPETWSEFEEHEKVERAEVLKQEQEATEEDFAPEYTIRMRFR